MKMTREEFNRDVDRRIERLLKSHEEFRVELRELKEAQKKTDEQLKKTDAEIRELKEAQKKTDEQIRELKEAQKKTDEQIKKTNDLLKKTIQRIAELTDSWGDYTEGVAFPAVKKEFIELGFALEDDYICVKKTLNGKQEEMDILLLGNKNGRNVIFACEVKTTLNRKKIDKMIEEDLKDFFLFFKEYRDRELIGGIAAVKARKETIEYAKKKGLYVFCPSDNTMELINPECKPMILKYKDRKI